MILRKCFRYSAIITLAIVTASAPAVAQTAASESQSKTSSTADSSLNQFARHNDMQMALAEIGARKAQKPELKQLCLQIQEQQKQLNAQLQPILKQQGLTLNQPLGKAEQAELDKLNQAAGSTFDAALAKYVAREQKQAIAQLQKASSGHSESSVKQYAVQALPQLQQQQQKLQSLAGIAGDKENALSGGPGNSSTDAKGGSEGPK